ncbi:hypothetical protein [Desulfoplanes sp.]
MIPFPSVCDHCGASFVDAFGGTLDGRIRLEGQSRPGCPVCGGNISLPNGRYGFVGHVIRLLSRPAVQEADLKKIDGLMRDLEDGKISLAGAEERIAKDLGGSLFMESLLAWYGKSPQESLVALAGLFRDIIAALLAYFPGRDADFGTFEHAVNEHVILTWERKSREQKGVLEGLVLAPVSRSGPRGTTKMEKLKRARKKLKART